MLTNNANNNTNTNANTNTNTNTNTNASKDKDKDIRANDYHAHVASQGSFMIGKSMSMSKFVFKSQFLYAGGVLFLVSCEVVH